MSQQQSDELITFIDFHYAILCSSCGSKVLDPDKKKNQMYLTGKCPSCGKSSSAVSKQPKLSKKERKALKRARRALEQVR